LIKSGHNYNIITNNHWKEAGEARSWFGEGVGGGGREDENLRGNNFTQLADPGPK